MIENESVDQDIIQENKSSPSITLYSFKAIILTTFLCGPLSPGIMMRKNFINLGKVKQGDFALLISILVTAIIFSLLFFISENIINKVPSFLIPFVYTGITSLVLTRTQGKVLKDHIEHQGKLYSGWKALGVGIMGIIGLLIIICFLGIFLLLSNNIDDEKYDNIMTEFTTYEEKAIALFPLMEENQPEKIILFIDKKGIPAWQHNIALLDEADTIENLPQELIRQNKLLHEYCTLRIESYSLIKKAYLNDDFITDEKQFENINNRIHQLIELLNE